MNYEEEDVEETKETEEKFYFNPERQKFVPSENELNITLQKLAKDIEPEEQEIEYLVDYVMSIHAVKEPISEDRLDEVINEMVLSTMLANLVDKGLLDVSFEGEEPTYLITEDGKKVMEKLGE